LTARLCSSFYRTFCYNGRRIRKKKRKEDNNDEDEEEEESMHDD